MDSTSLICQNELTEILSVHFISLPIFLTREIGVNMRLIHVKRTHVVSTVPASVTEKATIAYVNQVM